MLGGASEPASLAGRDSDVGYQPLPRHGSVVLLTAHKAQSSYSMFMCVLSSESGGSKRKREQMLTSSGFITCQNPGEKFAVMI